MRRYMNGDDMAKRRGATLVLLALSVLILCGAGLLTLAGSATLASSSYHDTSIPRGLSQARRLLNEGRIDVSW